MCLLPLPPAPRHLLLLTISSCSSPPPPPHNLPPPPSPPPPPDGPDGVTISPSSPPSFIASGGSFNLSCGASSWPTASFSWYREKQLLEHFQEVLPQKVLEVYGLNKPPASYTCVATNTKTGRAVPSPAVTLGIMGESQRRPCGRAAPLHAVNPCHTRVGGDHLHIVGGVSAVTLTINY